MRDSATFAGGARAKALPRSHRRTTESRASTPRSKADTSTTANSSSGPRFHFVGGKGGVGKTTCAAAIALHTAGRGGRVLVASTDPASSLGDALRQPLTSTPQPVSNSPGRLAAVEIDAERSLRRWLRGRRDVLEAIALQGTWLDQDDISKLMRLSLPGIDEVAALLEISRLSQTRRWDVVVVDTAPTGHTLRMLSMPDTFAAIAGVFAGMREKHRVIESALRGGWRPGPEDALIAEMSALAEDLSRLLRDRSRTRISWVTLPEPMAVAETADAVNALGRAEIHVADVIVNRVTPPPRSACGHCDARRAFEARAMRSLPRQLPLSAVTARRAEPRGVRALRAIGGELIGGASAGLRVSPLRRWTATLAGVPPPPEVLATPSTRLIMFGGKGGVGKTTCAASLALQIAHRSPTRRVLLVSTDPAHSLADVLGTTIGDTARRLPDGPANLAVREIDPPAVLARMRDRYLEAIDAMFDRIAMRSFDATHDRAVMQSLIQLAPPGLDELSAVLEITDALSADPSPWDLVIMDTAPTGHALRLLEMPALLHEWTKALMTVLLQYQGVARLGELGEMLLNLSRGIRRLRELISNEEVSRFVLVTRAAALPRLESVRLATQLRALKIHVPAVVVNAVGRGTCPACVAAARAERREIRELRRSLTPQSLLVILAATQVPAPLGPSALRLWARRSWRVAPGYDRTR